MHVHKLNNFAGSSLLPSVRKITGRYSQYIMTPKNGEKWEVACIKNQRPYADIYEFTTPRNPAIDNDDILSASVRRVKNGAQEIIDRINRARDIRG